MQKRKSKKSYICGIDWQHEIGEANDVRLFASVESLKKHRQCWKECGIVELDIRVTKWVEPQNLFMTDEEKKNEKI